MKLKMVHIKNYRSCKDVPIGVSNLEIRRKDYLKI